MTDILTRPITDAVSSERGDEMNKVVRGVITGSILGTALGLTMLFRKNTSQKMALKRHRMRRMNRRVDNTLNMVRSQAKDWTSGLKESTGTLTKNLLRRTH